MFICKKCYKEVYSREEHICLGKPERYHEWVSWKLRKEKYEKTCTDNTWTPWNMKNYNTSDYS